MKIFRTIAITLSYEAWSTAFERSHRLQVAILPLPWKIERTKFKVGNIVYSKSLQIGPVKFTIG